MKRAPKDENSRKLYFEATDYKDIECNQAKNFQ